MEFKFADKPLDISEVEPASAIVKRFCTGQYTCRWMSFYEVVLGVPNH